MGDKDNIFQKDIKKQFEFDKEVASVFDDMISRSVPFYETMLDISVKFALLYSKENSTIQDLGCSTANTLIKIAQKSDKKLNLIGIDSSKDMIEFAKNKINAYKMDIKLIQDDILSVVLEKSDVIISNYTLQFIRPLQREILVKKIHDSLNSGGIFICSEKIISDNKRINKEFIDIYYDYKKKQGYSEFEIIKKREALENVLVPYSVDENIQMFKKCGFKHIEIIFKWVNFCLFLCVKD